jgi:hypothetical protein
MTCWLSSRQRTSRPAIRRVPRPGSIKLLIDRGGRCVIFNDVVAAQSSGGGGGEFDSVGGGNSRRLFDRHLSIAATMGSSECPVEDDRSVLSA